MSKRTLENALNELTGHASLCWKEKPYGVFDSSEALKASSLAHAEIVEALGPVREGIALLEQSSMTPFQKSVAERILTLLDDYLGREK